MPPFLQRIFGGNVDPVLRPLILVALTGSIAGGTMWSFIGIWAKERLEATDSQLGVAFLFGAFSAMAGGYLGGHLSDRYGRRPLMLFGFGVGMLVPLLFLLVGDRVLVGLVLLSVLGFFGTVGHAADQAMIADLVPPERHESSYAAMRVTQNLGVVMGPPLGALLLLGENWNRLFIGGAVLTALAFVVAYRLIPERGEYTPERGAETAGSSLRLLTRDRIFLVFFASGCLATLVYVSYETVLPISLVDTQGISPSTWGFLLVINPAMVTIFQLRLTGWTSRVPASIKLSAAMLLMGLPFLALTSTPPLTVVGLVIFVFVIGEMLWVPTSQTLIARIAPPESRGAYMGAFGSTFAVGFALTPFVGLQVRDTYGDGAMWVMFASLGVVAAVLGFVACREAFGVRGTATGPLDEAAADAAA